MIQKMKRAAFALLLAVPAFLICSPEARAAGPSVVAFLKTYFAGGSANQVWTNNGDGTAKWATASAGGGGSLQADYAAGGATGGTILATSTAKTFNLTAGPATSVGGSSTFAARVDYTSGSDSEAVAVGDLNGDARLDVVVANVGGNTVSVFLGNGDGTLAAKVDYTVGTGPQSVTLADLNGDGVLDIVTGNFSTTTVSVLLGNGDGTFAGKVDYTVLTGPYGTAVADLNGDGKLDIVVADHGSNKVSVLLGNGDGTFQAHVDYTTAAAPYAVALGDMNGDGILDIVTSSGSVLLGIGDGTFAAKVDFTIGGGGSPLPSIAIGDLNGDGILDVMIPVNSAQVSVLLGKGNGTFQPFVLYTTGSFPGSIALGDVNGDGRLDLVVADYTDAKISVLLGNGDGTFAAKVDSVTAASPYWAVIGDLNGDGKPDVVVGSGDAVNKVSVFLGAGGATPGGGQSFQLGRGASSGLEGQFTVRSSTGLPLVTIDGTSGITTFAAMGKPGKYNGLTPVAMGWPTIVTQGRFTGLAAAKASVCAYKTGPFDQTYEVVMNVLVTTATTHTFTCQCTYTDEGNTARTVTLPFRLVGDTTALTSSIVNTNGAVPYNGVPLRIRCKAATTITLLTQAAGTYTTVVFNVEGDIRRVS